MGTTCGVVGETACCWPPGSACEPWTCEEGVSYLACAAGGGHAKGYGGTCEWHGGQCSYPVCVYEAGGVNPQCCDYSWLDIVLYQLRPAVVDWNLVPPGQAATCAHVTCPENEPPPPPADCDACPELDPMPSIMVVSGISLQCCINIECSDPPAGNPCLRSNAACEALPGFANGAHVMSRHPIYSDCSFLVQKTKVFYGGSWGMSDSLLSVIVTGAYDRSSGQLIGGASFLASSAGGGWHAGIGEHLASCESFSVELPAGQWEAPTTTTEECEQIPPGKSRA
ncbi:MAG: hypothetical protein ABII12_03105, partial [Planctomycetota bacterium]